MTPFQPANMITLCDAAHRVLMWEACIFSARLSAASIPHRSLPKPEPNPTAVGAVLPQGFCHPVLTNSPLSGPSKCKNIAEL